MRQEVISLGFQGTTWAAADGNTFQAPTDLEISLAQLTQWFGSVNADGAYMQCGIATIASALPLTQNLRNNVLLCKMVRLLTNVTAAGGAFIAWGAELVVPLQWTMVKGEKLYLIADSSHTAQCNAQLFFRRI